MVKPQKPPTKATEATKATKATKPGWKTKKIKRKKIALQILVPNNQSSGCETFGSSNWLPILLEKLIPHPVLSTLQLGRQCLCRRLFNHASITGYLIMTWSWPSLVELITHIERVRRRISYPRLMWMRCPLYRTCAAACDISLELGRFSAMSRLFLMDLLRNKKIGSAKMAGIYGCSSPQNVANDIAKKNDPLL